jgi:hypothetical protein
MLDAGVARSQLMRLTSSGLEELLAFESKWDNGESTSETRCELARGSGVHGGFFDQEVECTTAVGSWHDEDPADRGEQRTAEQKRYRWNGRAYEE